LRPPQKRPSMCEHPPIGRLREGPGNGIEQYGSQRILRRVAPGPRPWRRRAAFANSSFYSAFTTRYPASATATHAGCNTCHGGSTSTFNAYGRDVQAAAGTEAAASLPSRVSIPTGKATATLPRSTSAPSRAGARSRAATTTAAPCVLGGAAAGIRRPTSRRSRGRWSVHRGRRRTHDARRSGSTDPDGTIAAYAWNFGNGTSGSGARRARRTRASAPSR